MIQWKKENTVLGEEEEEDGDNGRMWSCREFRGSFEICFLPSFDIQLFGSWWENRAIYLLIIVDVSDTTDPLKKKKKNSSLQAESK